MTLPSTTFPERAKMARLLRGCSQDQMACQMERPQMTICRWETGKSKPTPSSAADLARFLNVNLLWLLTGEGPMSARIEKGQES